MQRLIHRVHLELDVSPLTAAPAARGVNSLSPRGMWKLPPPTGPPTPQGGSFSATTSSSTAGPLLGASRHLLCTGCQHLGRGWICGLNSVGYMAAYELFLNAAKRTCCSAGDPLARGERSRATMSAQPCALFPPPRMYQRFWRTADAWPGTQHPCSQIVLGGQIEQTLTLEGGDSPRGGETCACQLHGTMQL